MVKWFIFSDTHGCFTALKTSLQKAGYNEHNPQHMLLGLGDYFDRGNENVEMYKFLLDKYKNKKGIFLRGNHDAFFYDFLMDEDDGLFNMAYNGMDITVNQFSGLNVKRENLYLTYHSMRQIINQNHPQLRGFLRSMPDKYEINNMVFVHAGYSKTSELEDKWYIDNWANTEKFVKDFDTGDKVYVFGHWHASKLNKKFGLPESNIFKYKNFIGIDTMTNKTGDVNILVVDAA